VGLATDILSAPEREGQRKCHTETQIFSGGSVDMIFERTFKGYEDKTAALDQAVNDWIAASKVEVVDVKASLNHEPGSKAKSGDLLYTVLYSSDAPVA
jgi:hypothetical protein